MINPQSDIRKSHYLRKAAQLDTSPIHDNKRSTLKGPCTTPYNTETDVLWLFCISTSSQTSGLHNASFCYKKCLSPTTSWSQLTQILLTFPWAFPFSFSTWKCLRPLGKTRTAWHPADLHEVLCLFYFSPVSLFVQATSDRGSECSMT